MAKARLLSRGTFLDSEAQQWPFAREFDAVIKAIEAFQENIRNTCVRLLCDNTVVVTAINCNTSGSAAVR